jgi:hypothetical protein
MKTHLLLVIFTLLFSVVAVCQNTPSYRQFPTRSDSDSFFKILFGKNGSINLPYQVVKLEIKDHPYYIISSKGGFKEFLKKKYNLSDSLAEIQELSFLRGNNKISITDTIFLVRNPQFGRVDMYHDSTLQRYRNLDLLDFLNSYCKKPQYSQTIFALAYMFEKRILYDWNNEQIDYVTTSLLGTKYNIIWDREKKLWVYSN